MLRVLLVLLVVVIVITLIVIVVSTVTGNPQSKDGFETTLTPANLAALGCSDDPMAQWDLSKDFNDRDYTNCCKLIDFVYQIFNDSKASVISTVDVQQQLLETFNLDDARLHTGSDNFVEFVGNSQYIIATTGRICGTRTAVVAFRGTQTYQEWLTNFLTIYRPIDLTRPEAYGIGASGIGKVSTLPGVSQTDLEGYKEKGIHVASGWFSYYCRQNSATASGCFCDHAFLVDQIQKYLPSDTCPVLTTEYSQIDRKCGTRGTEKIDPRKALFSMGRTIYDEIFSLVSSGSIDNVIITGHSLGGALATLCAFQLAMAFGPSIIHSVYTFAAPELGFQDFAEIYNRVVSPHYRVNNTKDIVGLLTSQLFNQGKDAGERILKSFLGQDRFNKIFGSVSIDSDVLHTIQSFTPVGIDKSFTITDGSDKDWGEGQYHDIDGDYLAKGRPYFFPAATKN